jgi:hypothetical protein
MNGRSSVLVPLHVAAVLLAQGDLHIDLVAKS